MGRPIQKICWIEKCYINEWCFQNHKIIQRSLRSFWVGAPCLKHTTKDAKQQKHALLTRVGRWHAQSPQPVHRGTPRDRVQPRTPATDILPYSNQVTTFAGYSIYLVTTCISGARFASRTITYSRWGPLVTRFVGYIYTQLVKSRFAESRSR